VTGIIAGVLYLWGSESLIRNKLDDAVDAIPVHMINGLWGLIAVGLMSHPDHMLHAYGRADSPGLFYIHSHGGNANLMVCQIVGALFIFGWTTFTMFPFFLWLNYMGWFRCESVQELVGLDITYDGERAVAVKNEEGSEEGLKDEYMQAYQRYKQAKIVPRQSPSGNQRRDTSHSCNKDEDDDSP